MESINLVIYIEGGPPLKVSIILYMDFCTLWKRYLIINFFPLSVEDVSLSSF